MTSIRAWSLAQQPEPSSPERDTGSSLKWTLPSKRPTDHTTPAGPHSAKEKPRAMQDQRVGGADGGAQGTGAVERWRVTLRGTRVIVPTPKPTQHSARPRRQDLRPSLRPRPAGSAASPLPSCWDWALRTTAQWPACGGHLTRPPWLQPCLLDGPCLRGGTPAPGDDSPAESQRSLLVSSGAWNHRCVLHGARFLTRTQRERF